MFVLDHIPKLIKAQMNTILYPHALLDICNANALIHKIDYRILDICKLG